MGTHGHTEELRPAPDQAQLFFNLIEQRLGLLEEALARAPATAVEQVAGLVDALRSLDQRLLALESRHREAWQAAAHDGPEAQGREAPKGERARLELRGSPAGAEAQLAEGSAGRPLEPSLRAVTFSMDDMEEDHTFNTRQAEQVFKRLMELQHQHKLGDTVFEAVLVVGLNGMRRWDSVLTAISLALAVFLQLMFITVLELALVKPTLPSIQSVRQWRFLEGNHLSRMDTRLGVSLASRVCHFDETISEGREMLELLRTLQNYHSYLGWLLALTGVVVWCFHISREVRSCISFLISVFTIPTAKATSMGACDAGILRLRGISKSRRVAMVIVTLVRATLAILIGQNGALWLVHEEDLRELILNVGALALILDLDIIVYREVASRRVTTVIEDLAPLPMKEHRCCGTSLVGIIHISVLSFCIAFSTIMAWVYIQPTHAHVGDIMSAVCREPLDWVYAETRLGLWVVTPTVPFESVDWNTIGLKFEDVGKHFKSGSVFESLALLPVPNVQSMAAWVDMSVGAEASAVTTRLGSNCTDTLGEAVVDGEGTLPAVVAWTLRAGLGNASVASCWDVRRHCQEEAWRLVRAMCPETCGCARPRSGLLWSGPDGGCPKEACQESPAFLAALDALPCEDEAEEALRQMEAWATFLHAWLQKTIVHTPGQQAAAESLHAQLLQDGCAALAGAPVEVLVPLCRGDHAAGGILEFCPRACGCLAGNVPGCPTACAWG